MISTNIPKFVPATTSTFPLGNPISTAVLNGEPPAKSLNTMIPSQSFNESIASVNFFAKSSVESVASKSTATYSFASPAIKFKLVVKPVAKWP